jgi:hypothetical protein
MHADSKFEILSISQIHQISYCSLVQSCSAPAQLDLVAAQQNLSNGKTHRVCSNFEAQKILKAVQHRADIAGSIPRFLRGILLSGWC